MPGIGGWHCGILQNTCLELGVDIVVSFRTHAWHCGILQNTCLALWYPSEHMPGIGVLALWYPSEIMPGIWGWHCGILQNTCLALWYPSEHMSGIGGWHIGIVTNKCLVFGSWAKQQLSEQIPGPTINRLALYSSTK